MKVKKIVWRRGRYGFIRGYVDKVRLFTITYDPECYVLTSTLPGSHRQEDTCEQGCKDLAHALLRLFVIALTEEGA